MYFSTRKGVSQGASTANAARAFSRFFALFFVISALSFVGCSDDASGGGEGLDPRLVGTWQLDYTGGAERYVITADTLKYGNVYDGTFITSYEGTIRYAEEFTTGNGVIIIEYNAGHKQVWSDGNWVEDPAGSGNWVSGKLDPQPAGNFFGIYYNGLTGGAVGATVELSGTSDIANYYGPTETTTRALARAKFTEANQPLYMSLGATTPQTKTE
jgi:hypothetical protein